MLEKVYQRIAFLILVNTALLCTLNLDAKPNFIVQSNEATGVYSTGQEAIFTVQPISGEEASNTASVQILRDFSEPPLASSTFAQGAASLDLPFTATEPGWFVCSTKLPEQKRSSGASGVVYNPEAFQPTYPMPDDFDEFWDSQKGKLAANPVQPILTELSPQQMDSATDKPYLEKNITNMSAEGYQFFNVEIPCLDYRPVRGYYVMPPNSEPGNRPAIVIFHAAGVSGRWCRSNLNNALLYAKKYNAIVLDINAHGMLNDEPQSYYDELAKELDDYQHRGMKDRETSYFLGMYLRLMRAIDFLCDQPEWDGKNLICYGPSQGGAQVLAAAGLDSRVSIACALVPATCDIGGTPGGWPARDWGESTYQPEVVETMRYFDATNFCQRSQAATVITVGLIDTVCPPPGVYAAYNQLASPKLIIPMPNTGHIGGSSLKPGIREPVESFIKEHIKD
ncbi:acetylxylan esterase [Cerasicoccus frondis]|uniref:acetylxylan esterase n=1 Tax=Cerasicoccus frondis TaxID=490090 RepID=UPI002852831B|nr:acetylxylan esterase [Cerasicoccus frondis]